MNIRLVSIEQDGIVRLAANGSMTASEMASDDRHPLANVIGDRWASNRVVLSLSQAEYLDSTAIGWLLSCKKQFDREGGIFVLHSTPPSVKQIFDLLKVDRVLAMAPDEEQALEMARSAAQQGHEDA